jgi:Uma2 family endonuclease
MSTAEPTTGLYLCPEMAGTLMSPEEFDAVEDCDELWKYELVQGVLVVTPPPSVGERGPNEILGHLLLVYQETHRQGSALDLTLPESYVRTPDSRRRADRSIWTGLGRLPDERRDPPSITVEFVSEGRRDRERDYVVKRAEYLATGICEYWIIDRFAGQMTVIRREDSDSGAQDEIVIPADGVYSTPLLPGFELPLSRLLDVARSLEQARDLPDEDRNES